MVNDINFLGSTGLGRIQRYEENKASSITPISFPGQDSSKTEGIDTLGIISYINITGRLNGTFEEIQNTIAAIKVILDGKQTSSNKFKSAFVNSNAYTGAVKGYRIGNIGVNTSTSSSKLIDSAANFDTWGITTDDKVKNMVTGEVASVTAVDSATQLSLSSNIFTASSTMYVLTANINVKVLSFNTRWELPGLTYCNYEMSLMQVK